MKPLKYGFATVALALGIALLITAAGAYFYIQKDHGPQNTNGNQTATASKAESLTASSTWSFEDAGTSSSTSASRTKVTLHIGNKNYNAGTYDGTCTRMKASGLFENEVDGVLCWFAGFGDEIGIFKQGNGFMVQHGDVQEGTAEEPGFRGDFRTLYVIKP